MKSVRISDEAYKKIIKRSKKDKRTITATIDIMIDESVANVAAANEAATFDTSPYSQTDWDSEPDTDVERKPIRRAPVRDLTLEEMRQMSQMSQAMRSKSYYNQTMSDDEGE